MTTIENLQAALAATIKMVDDKDEIIKSLTARLMNAHECDHYQYSVSHHDCLEHGGDTDCYQSTCDNCNKIIVHSDN